MAGTFVGVYRYTVSRYDLDLTFDDVAVVTPTFKYYPCYILETARYRKLIVDMDIGCAV